MVIDSSALLANLFDEKAAPWVDAQLAAATTNLMMSTVNLTEVLIRVADRRSMQFDEVLARLQRLGVQLVPPDLDQAVCAADARHRLSMNLGDCFAYALAIAERVPILTLDSDFRRADCPVILPP
jgi:ribonuclease VapC